jgi:hypothetical protein
LKCKAEKNPKGRYDKKSYVSAVCRKYFDGAMLTSVVNFFCGPPSPKVDAADELLLQACAALGEDNSGDFEQLAQQAESAVANRFDKPREQRGRTPAHIANLIPQGISGCYVTKRVYVRQYQGFFPNAFRA